MTEKTFFISSDDRYLPESKTPSNFVVNLKERYNSQNISRILIKSVSVPNNFYNVRDGSTGAASGEKNNTIKLQQAGETDVTVDIPIGQYDIDSFLAALKTAVDSVLVGGATVVFTLDSLTQKIVATHTGTPALYYNFEDGNLAAELMGIANTTVAASTVNFDSLPELGGLKEVYVHSKDLAQAHGIDGDFGLISVVESVSLHDTPFGGQAYRKNEDDILSMIEYDKSRNLSRIRIRLRDRKGNLLDIGTGRMSIEVRAFYSV